MVLPRLLTRDISSAGAFVLTEVLLPVGSAVQVQFVLRSRAGTTRPARTAWVKVKGEVVRVDRDGVAIRFAPGFSFTKYREIAPESLGH